MSLMPTSQFIQRIQKAENLQKSKRAVVLAGNTRAGKSTLSCAAAGSDMRIDYDGIKKFAFIHPANEQYKDLVRNSYESVTEVPNFFPHDPQGKKNRYAIIDLPGYSDSSRVRELINFHYISTMIKNLEEVRFYLVLNMPYSQGKFRIDEEDVKMMESFSNMFPNCSQVVGIIVNKVEFTGNNYDKLITEALLKTFNDQQYLKDNYNVANTAKFKSYYSKSLSNMQIIIRPSYQASINGAATWSQNYPTLQKDMMRICNNQNAKFIPTKDIHIQLNIFRSEDKTGNEKFLDQINNYVKDFDGIICQTKKIYSQIFISLLQQSHQSKPIAKLKTILDDFLKQHTIPNRDEHWEKYLPRDYLAKESRLLAISERILTKKLNFVNQPHVDNRMNECLQFLRQNFAHLKVSFGKYNPQMSKQANLIFILFLRLAQYYYYLLKTAFLKQKNNQQKVPDIFAIGDKLNNMQKFYSFQMQADEINRLYGLVTKNMDYFLKLNLRQFMKKEPTEQLKDELIHNFNIIRTIYHIPTNIYLDQQLIDKKIKEVQLLYWLKCQLGLPAFNKKIKDQLFILYRDPDTPTNYKFQIAIRLASIYEHEKQPKKAIGLYLLLQLNEKTLKILEQIISLSPENSCKWCLQISQQYLKKNNQTYFQACLEKAKLYATEVEQFVNIQEKLVKGKEAISKGPIYGLNAMKAAKIQEKLNYWNWDRIDQEVAFLRKKQFPTEKYNKPKEPIFAEQLR